MARKLQNGEITYTQLPILPTHPGFSLEYTPYEWRRQCWLMNPPQCPECGFNFTRPESSNSNRRRSQAYEFCSNGCRKRWQDRLRYTFVPFSRRNEDWPGKRDGLPPPDIQDIKLLWNTERDRQKYGKVPPLEYCGRMGIGYPTNDFPMHKDTRGKPCQQPAGLGTDHPGMGPCFVHGGRLESVTKHWNMKKAQRKMQEHMAIFGAPINITPEEAIIQELHRTAGIVNWLEQKITQVANEQNENAALTQSTKAGQMASVWMDMFQKERDRLATISKTAAGMGIAQRQIQIAEEQGKMLASVIQRLLDHPALQLTPAQRVNAPDVIRELLMSLPTAAPGIGAAQTDHSHKARIVGDSGYTVATEEYLAQQQDDDLNGASEIIDVDALDDN